MPKWAGEGARDQMHLPLWSSEQRLYQNSSLGIPSWSSTLTWTIQKPLGLQLRLSIHTFVSSAMRATYFLSAVFVASAAATSAIDAFKRVDKVLESRTAERRRPSAPEHGKLQKRASPFLNNVTQSVCSAAGVHARCSRCGRICCRRNKDTRCGCKIRRYPRCTASLPKAKFDIGESYAGLVPISSNANETRELYFWLGTSYRGHQAVSTDTCPGSFHPQIPPPQMRSLYGITNLSACESHIC